MSIYYYKLWQLMEKKSIEPVPFFEDLHLALGTVSKLKKDIPVSFEVLDRIRAALDCDYGDIITAKPQKNAVPRDALTKTVEKHSDMCREALKNCMANAPSIQPHLFSRNASFNYLHIFKIASASLGVQSNSRFSRTAMFLSCSGKSSPQTSQERDLITTFVCVLRP